MFASHLRADQFFEQPKHVRFRLRELDKCLFASVDLAV